MRIFCSAKYSHIFSTKNNKVFVIFMFEILMMSLISNNWPLICSLIGHKCLKKVFKQCCLIEPRHEITCPPCFEEGKMLNSATRLRFENLYNVYMYSLGINLSRK